MDSRSGIVHFTDPCSANHGRALLALGEPLGAFSVDIYAREFVAVVIVDGDFPMSMLATAVAGELGWLLHVIGLGLLSLSWAHIADSGK